MMRIKAKFYTDRSIRSTFKKMADSQDEWTYAESEIANNRTKFVLKTPKWEISTHTTTKANSKGMRYCDFIMAYNETTGDTYCITDYRTLSNFLLKEELGIVNYN